MVNKILMQYYSVNPVYVRLIINLYIGTNNGYELIAVLVPVILSF